MTTDAPLNQTPKAGGFESALALTIVYVLLAPGLAVLIYLAMLPATHPHEFVLFFYFLGTPMTLAVSLIHWLLRRLSGWSSAVIVIPVGAALAAIGGPEAMFAAAIAYMILFPIAHGLYWKLASPPLPAGGK